MFISTSDLCRTTGFLSVALGNGFRRWTRIRVLSGFVQCQRQFDTRCTSVASSLTMPMKPLKAMTIDGRERGALAPCTVCTKEAHRRQEGTDRPHSSYNRRRPPTPADLDRLSRPKSVPTSEASNNCNWSNFIRRKSKYGKHPNTSSHPNECLPSAIKSPNALCDLAYREENSETRPPFVNYGGRYDDKQYGQKRTFNSLAIHVGRSRNRSSAVRFLPLANEAS